MPRFTLLPADAFDLARYDWASNEQHLIDASVQQQGGVALVHCGCDGIVVPRSYRHKPSFAAARAALAADGLPVHIRLSGGGVVPQSPATVNLQLAYPARATHPAVARTKGSIDGVPVIVGTAERLRELRNGYDPHPEDEHDLELLSRLRDGGAGQQPESASTRKPVSLKVECYTFRGK